MKKLADLGLVMTDWSGVISDDRRPVYEANMRVVQKHGVRKITFDEWLPRTQLGARELFASMGLTENSSILFQEYTNELSKVHDEGIHPAVYADAKDFFQKVSDAGKRLVVISSHPVSHLRQEADEYGLTEYISDFVGNATDK